MVRLGAAAQWTPPAGRLVATAALTARIVGEHGPPIVLLHGLAGSNRYWGGVYDTLAMGHRLVIPDLLGFGRSPQPDCAYTADDHVAAIVECLDELDVGVPALVVGHSLGALLSLRLASTHPERAAAVIGFSPPLFSDAHSARRRIGAHRLTRPFVLPGPLSGAVCRWMCNHRAVAARIASLTHPLTPKPIAFDSVQHSWRSYSRTLQQVIIHGDAELLRGVSAPTLLVAGRNDSMLDLEHLRRVTASRALITLEEWCGGHDLPLTAGGRCCERIAAMARAVAG